MCVGGGQRLTSCCLPQLLPHLIFWDGVSHWTRSFPFGLGWRTTKASVSACLSAPSAWVLFTRLLESPIRVLCLHSKYLAGWARAPAPSVSVVENTDVLPGESAFSLHLNPVCYFWLSIAMQIEWPRQLFSPSIKHTSMCGNPANKFLSPDVLKKKVSLWVICLPWGFRCQYSLGLNSQANLK